MVDFRAYFQFAICRPNPLNEECYQYRREDLVEVRININELPATSWDYIRVPNTEDSEIPRCLDLALDVRGATTGIPFVSACRECSAQSPDGFSDFSLFHYARKDRLIRFIHGEARVPFRFRCSPRHHGTTDTEYW